MGGHDLGVTAAEIEKGNGVILLGNRSALAIELDCRVKSVFNFCAGRMILYRHLEGERMTLRK